MDTLEADPRLRLRLQLAMPPLFLPPTPTPTARSQLRPVPALLRTHHCPVVWTYWKQTRLLLPSPPFNPMSIKQSDSDAAGAALSARLDVLEADPTGNSCGCCLKATSTPIKPPVRVPIQLSVDDLTCWRLIRRPQPQSPPSKPMLMQTSPTPTQPTQPWAVARCAGSRSPTQTLLDAETAAQVAGDTAPTPTPTPKLPT